MEALSAVARPLERKIRVIPVNPKYDYRQAEAVKIIRRAAYARVSSDTEEQLSSYRAQVRYYTDTLSKMPNTEFVGIYADEGITGVNINKRKEFKRLIDDCRNGKIDEVWCKSISRFARNTLDALQYIRELKALNINIHFEGINVDTMDNKGELLITILASIAEEESRNISANVRWSVVKRFEEGKVIVSNIYGYRLDNDGNLEIEPSEACIVRRIYREFLDGYTAAQIAKRLNEDGVPTYYGKRWTAAGVMKVLTQEKMCGNAVLQKTYMASFLAKKRMKNEGQVKQWEVENSHPAIVDKDTWDKVQSEIQRRADLSSSGERLSGKYRNNYVFSTMIKCECGDGLRRWKQGRKNEAVWVCKTHQADKSKCPVKPIKESAIQAAFVRMVNKLTEDKDGIIADIMVAANEVITDTDKTDYEAKTIELNTCREEMMAISKGRAAGTVSSEEYRVKTAALMERIDTLTEETAQMSRLMHSKSLATHRLDDIRQALENDILNTFDADLFKRLVKEITVHTESGTVELKFELLCGISVREVV
jgi:DNA invertase Pin-like site-specific DNA recombinase